ncbi:MAG: DNA polymerase III subunit delta', partial [Methylocystis sp.]|nr:DNA polymerase III subunit delta' [Methylocystis sp.]
MTSNVVAGGDANPESDRFDDAPHPRQTLGFFGNREAERELLDAFRQNRMAQAWLISGPEGVGKATLAWRLARFLLAHPDRNALQAQQAVSLAVPAAAPASRRIAALALADTFLLRREWNEKTNKHYTEIRIEDVRKVIHLFHHGAGAGGWRAAIVDCADDLNRSSANALLKLIEEPPERALFLIVAHQPGRLLPTIRSRCRKLALGPLSEADVASAVRALGAPWSHLSQETIAAAAKGAEGSVREALRLLDGDGVAFDANLRALFAKLPQVNWLAVH